VSSTSTDLSRVLIGSTIPAFKCERGQDTAWLTHGDEWVERGATFFLAAQIGQGHDERLDPVIELVKRLHGVVWRFVVDQGEDEVTGHNRIIAICTGRNLIQEYALRDPDYDAILFIDSDITPPVDGPERLLEVDRPMVGGHIPSYNMKAPAVVWRPHPGPTVPTPWDGPGVCTVVDNPDWEDWRDHPPFPEGASVQEHWNSAGALLVRREVFRWVRWGWDPAVGLTDDPSYQQAAEKMGFGMTWVRHDSLWHHEALTPLEYRGHDLSVQRGC
jgi:hypothetical protein